MNSVDEHGESGTVSLIAWTRKKCSKMNIGMRLTKDEGILMTSESEYKTKTAVEIGRLLTQKMIRREKIKKLMNHEV
jgi:hypothetical protein